MKIELSDDELELIDKALRHYHAYTVAVNREYAAYRDLADRLKGERRKPAESERPEPKSKKRTG